MHKWEHPLIPFHPWKELLDKFSHICESKTFAKHYLHVVQKVQAIQPVQGDRAGQLHQRGQSFQIHQGHPEYGKKIGHVLDEYIKYENIVNSAKVEFIWTEEIAL